MKAIKRDLTTFLAQIGPEHPDVRFTLEGEAREQRESFAGLTPLLLEKATQAQFLIPMAVWLGFGILFATVITLLLVPINYLALEDLRALARRAMGGGAPPAAASRA